MDYSLALHNFEGPFQKLLQLVLEKKLEITTVNIAKVTDDFLVYFEKIRAAEAEKEGELDLIADADFKTLLADFVLVVSRLILIKSKVLLPDLEFDEEDEFSTKDLEDRLRLYKDFRGAIKNIADLWHAEPFMRQRDFLVSRTSVFYPPENITFHDLAKALQRLETELQKFVMPEKPIKNEAINLRKKIEEVLLKISEGLSDFSGIAENKSRKELVVLFLAVLHLIKEQALHVNQDSHFGAISIAKRDVQSYNGQDE